MSAYLTRTKKKTWGVHIKNVDGVFFNISMDYINHLNNLTSPQKIKLEASLVAFTIISDA